MSDFDRAAFEEWMRKVCPGLRADTSEIAFAAWQARASRPVVVTDEMARQGAWAPLNEFAKRLGLQPFDPHMAPDTNDIERARLIISAALNGGT